MPQIEPNFYSVTMNTYPNLLDPTNFSGPNANPGFPRDVGETPGFFRKITGLEEKPGFFPICWKFRPMITDDLEE